MLGEEAIGCLLFEGGFLIIIIWKRNLGFKLDNNL
jgi:hypothetical protein